ncbi:MAG: hypothetical protein JST67_06665 [Bacteroidetes bacterium]|nr:hypothetical protein [Bacteroidota bacterium]
MNTIKKTLLYNWHFVRVVRLLLGIIVAYQAVSMRDVLAGGVALFFLVQALGNIGCCGTSACAIPMPEKKDTLSN